MQFQTPLLRAKLRQRYKRFLADAVLESGEEVTAHCGNPGKMTGLAETGSTIWVEPNDDPKRKLNYAWKIAEIPDGLAIVDTNMANRIVAEALTTGQISPLAAYDTIRPEVRYGNNNRVDFMLQSKGLPDCYLEVKSVTLSLGSARAAFPDTKTARGARHMAALADMVGQGHRAILLYLVNRTDCETFELAADIDPTYDEAATLAANAGVESICFRTDITLDAASLGPQLPIQKT